MWGFFYITNYCYINIYTIGLNLLKISTMDDSLGVCEWFNYMDTVLYWIHDDSWPQETSDYPYCLVLECSVGPLGYCTGIDLLP